MLLSLVRALIGAFRFLIVSRWGLSKLSLMMTSALRPPLARLLFNMFMTITPLLVRTGVGWLLWQLNMLIASLLWWKFDVSQAWVLRSLAFGGLKVMPA
jgi:hypothetical protein